MMLHVGKNEWDETYVLVSETFIPDLYPEFSGSDGSYCVSMFLTDLNEPNKPKIIDLNKSEARILYNYSGRNSIWQKSDRISFWHSMKAMP